MQQDMQQDMRHGILSSGRTALAILLLLSLHTLSSGQTTDSDEAKKKKASAEKRAIELLEEIISTTQTLKIPENRIQLLWQAADLYWERDEKRARAIISEIRDLLITQLNKANEPAWQRNLKDQRIQLRYTLIQSMAQRDLNLALEFAQSTRPDPANYLPQQMQQVDALTQQSLAYQIAEQDPARAARLAEESLSKGFSYELGRLMKTVATKDAKAAGKLAEKIFRKLQSENLTTNISTLRFVTSFLDSEFKSRHTDVSPGEKLAAMTKPASILTDESLREWTDLLAGATPAMLEAAVTGKSRNVADAINGLSSILRLLPDLEKFSPALTQNLRKKYAEVSPKLEDPVREWIEIDIIQRNGKVADLLALAEKVSELQKPGIYSQAVWMALNIEADFETARKIVNEHIADPEQKKSQLRMIEWVYSQYCADQGKLEEAIAAADKLGSESERLRILADLVESPIKKGNRKLAMQMLERTLNLFPQEIESAGQLQAMARIIQHLAGLNAEQGFVMFEKNIEPLNQVVAARIIICRFEEYSQSWALRDEIMISSGYTYISPLLQYLEAVKSLARINLNRSIEIISRIRQPELRAYATLIATRAILLEP